MTQGTEVTASEAVLPLPSNAARSPETNVAPAPVEAQNGGSKPVERPRDVNPVQDAIKRMFSD